MSDSAEHLDPREVEARFLRVEEEKLANRKRALYFNALTHLQKFEGDEQISVLLREARDISDLTGDTVQEAVAFLRSRLGIREVIMVGDLPGVPALADHRLESLSLNELLRVERPRREPLVGPVFTRNLVELYAPRGVGKTFFSLELAYAVASGRPLFRWRAEEPRGVLYVDGEMAVEDLQERLALIALRQGDTRAPLRFICSDLVECGVPNLLFEDGQRAVEEQLEGISLLVLDNLSSLFGGAENDAEAWEPAHRWLLALRRRGLCVVFVHHAGKNNTSRGTSRREDPLDLIVSLRHPPDYEPTEGARFEVHFDKARALRGDVVEPFEAKLDGDTGEWVCVTLKQATLQRVQRLSLEGLSVAEIASTLQIQRAQVERVLSTLRLTQGRRTDGS